MDVVEINGYLKTWGKDYISFADICKLAEKDPKCTIVQIIIDAGAGWSDYMNDYHMIDFKALSKRANFKSIKFRTYPIIKE